jgi:urease accessory protein
MSAVASPSEVVLRRSDDEDPLSVVRVVGGASATFKAERGASHIDTLSEQGGYRLKFPTQLGSSIEAVVVNTGGGVACGDCVQYQFTAGAGASATIATATAERIYRSTGAVAAIDVRLVARPHATLAWLPQATILFSGARLQRRFEVDVVSNARMLMAEATVFGRTASGEVMGHGLLHDTWRVRRDGRLVFADATRLDGDLTEQLARPAIAKGARGVALLIAVAPGIEARLDAVRAAVADTGAEVGVSAWNGLLVLRAVATRLDTLQAVLRCAVSALQISAVPQVWGP